MTTWVNAEPVALVVKLSTGETVEVPACSTVQVPAGVRVETCERVKTTTGAQKDGALAVKNGVKA